jgi:hypothetical protein
MEESKALRSAINIVRLNHRPVIGMAFSAKVVLAWDRRADENFIVDIASGPGKETNHDKNAGIHEWRGLPGTRWCA